MPDVPVFLNMEMNAYRAIPDPMARKMILKKELLERYTESLDDAKLERYLAQHASSLLFAGVAPFMPFYDEAHTLYNEGYFYSCVCVCGITAERIESEIVHRAKAKRGPEEYGRRREQFESEGGKGTIQFLAHLGVITKPVSERMVRLRRKRNEYAHPEGALAMPRDAGTCIDDLAFVINELADVFKHYEIRKGVLVHKQGGANE